MNNYSNNINPDTLDKAEVLRLYNLQKPSIYKTVDNSRDKNDK